MRTYDKSEILRESDTEITLGLPSILGLFLGLALICGIFFGLGYSLGRTNSPRAAAPAKAVVTQTASAAPSPIKTIVEPAAEDPSKPAAGEPVPPPVTANPAALQAATTTTPAAPVAGQVAPAAYSAAAAKPISASFPPPAGSIMVQIAAVSRTEDANVLVSALRNLGYNASIRSEPTDKFLHVQIGPFTTRDQAMAMRAKLISDGYNAILK